MKKIRDIFSGNEGFTLIELLIVIVILGVLAAIAVPNLAGLGDSANVEAVKANMRTLMVELESDKATNYGEEDDETAYNGTYGNTDDGRLSELNGYTALQNQNQEPTSSAWDVSGGVLESYTLETTVGSTTITISNGTLTTSTTTSS